MILWLPVWCVCVCGVRFWFFVFFPFFGNCFLIIANWSWLQMEYLVAVLAQMEMMHVKFQCSYSQVVDSVNWCHPVFIKLLSLKITLPCLYHSAFSHFMQLLKPSKVILITKTQDNCLQCNFLYLCPSTFNIRSHLSKTSKQISAVCVSWHFRWGNGRTTHWAWSTLSGQGTALSQTATQTITIWVLSPWRRLPLSLLRTWILWWKVAKKTPCHVVNLSKLSK